MLRQRLAISFLATFCGTFLVNFILAGETVLADGGLTRAGTISLLIALLFSIVILCAQYFEDKRSEGENLAHVHHRNEVDAKLKDIKEDVRGISDLFKPRPVKASDGITKEDFDNIRIN